jgi:hypothetical protein
MLNDSGDHARHWQEQQEQKDLGCRKAIQLSATRFQ